MFRREDQAAHLHVIVRQTAVIVSAVGWKLFRLAQIRQQSGLLIWDSHKSVSLAVHRKAAVIQSWDGTNRYATFGFCPHPRVTVAFTLSTVFNWSSENSEQRRQSCFVLLSASCHSLLCADLSTRGRRLTVSCYKRGNQLCYCEQRQDQKTFHKNELSCNICLCYFTIPELNYLLCLDVFGCLFVLFNY